MPDIVHDFPINGSMSRVFEAVSTPGGIANWWSVDGTGEPAVGNEYSFDFGPGFQWRALVEECEPDRKFSLRMIASDNDWNGTLVSFTLSETNDGVMVRFEHLGWPEDNNHYRSSAYCWAMYLRGLKMYVEQGIVFDYNKRLDGVG